MLLCQHCFTLGAGETSEEKSNCWDSYRDNHGFLLGLRSGKALCGIDIATK